MTATWSPHELRCIDAASELRIAVKRADGTLLRWTPVRVVCAGGQVYVRTWYRRETGWFGEVVGEGTAELRESIDTAYGTRYGSAGSASMVTASAAATTLRLTPEPQAQLE